MTLPRTLLLAISSLCFALNPTPSCAEVQPEYDYDQFLELAPERCAERPPDAVFKLLLKSPQGWDSSLRGEDECYFAYQKQLQRYVDARYPGAKAYRAELQAAYHSMMEFLWEVWQPQNLAHQDVRVEAWVEWTICRGEKARFWPGRSVSGVLTLEKFCLELAERFPHGPQIDTVALPPLHAAIDHLIKATSHDRDAYRHEQWYFAAEMQRFVARYDKPEKKSPAKKRKR